MKIDSILFEDLMTECNFDDPAEFRKLLRRNGFPGLGQGKPVERHLADAISRRFLGRTIDWYKYKQRQRDLAGTGPLMQDNTIDSELVERWYRKVAPSDISQVSHRDHILGLLCVGGFLEGTHGTEFSLGLEPGINAFIGDRGTGKSTVLNLLSLLADSVSEETDALVTQLLDILSAQNPEELSVSKIVEINRRVRRILHSYSVEYYVLFYTKNHKLFGYVADITKHTFSIFQKEDGVWRPLDEQQQTVVPSILSFQQGEVIRIAEDRHRFYLNNILDALYTELYRKRAQLAQQLRQLANQYEHSKPSYTRTNLAATRRFIDDRARELGRFWADLDRGYFSEHNLETIQHYIYQFDSYVNENCMANPSAWKTTPIIELLRGGEEGLYCLYVGPIIGFLGDKLSEIDKVREQEAALAAHETRRSESSSGHLPIAALIPSETLSQILSDLSDERETLVEINRQDELKRKRRKAGMGTDSPSMEDEAVQDRNSDDCEVFPQAAKPKTRISDREGWHRIALEVVEFLDTRLRVLSKWVRIYSGRRVHWNEAFAALCDSYGKLLKARSRLLEFQEEKCHELTETLNEKELTVNIRTVHADEIISEYERNIEKIDNAQKWFYRLIEATPRIKLRELYDLATKYDNITQEIAQKLESLHDQAIESQPAFIFVPIDIELLQGNVYRGFQQLSFGQKSGIILKMVLTTTNKSLVIIDQPEDNLDVDSIVNMLAPTLNRVGQNKQIIIATHNSNLVMGLDAHSVCVLESRGENGRIRLQGSSSEQSLVREMIDVLEGGLYTFEKKMHMYEDFISRVRGQIEDIDITMIESSFRRYTIDKFRNFLQPVISDRSLLDFVRHELKQKDSSRIRQEIKRIREQIRVTGQDPGRESDRLLDQLDRLAEHLDNHIMRLQEAIEDIRLMDTEAKPKSINLFDLLTKLRETCLSGISEVRDVRIEIDQDLQNQLAYVDEDHLRLIFVNLFNNSLAATERRVIDAWSPNDAGDMSEVVRIELSEVTDSHILVKYSDNGCGMPAGILEKLYKERCTTQLGRDHGLGGVIIRKLLDLNNSGIRVLASHQAGETSGTIQAIAIYRARESQ